MLNKVNKWVANFGFLSIPFKVDVPPNAWRIERIWYRPPEIIISQNHSEPNKLFQFYKFLYDIQMGHIITARSFYQGIKP